MRKAGPASLGVLLAIALGACAPAEPQLDRSADSAPTSPAASAIERGAEERPPAGAQLSPTATRIQSPTTTPTAGPLPGATVTWPPSNLPLSRDGPWLLGYADPPEAPGELRALNADGGGLTRYSDYNFRHPSVDLRDGISDRHGMIGMRSVSCGITECDYILHLFRMPDHEPILEIKMLTPGLAWEAGQGTMADALAANPPLMAVGREAEEPALLWSRDGRYLAFVGAIDGPSADVYAYDRLTSAVQRLTDGPGQPVLMGWSPDSRWVVHMEAEFVYGERGSEYEPVAVWAADVQGGPASYLYASRGDLGDSEEIVGWRSESEFVAAERDPLGRTGRLALVNAQTGAFQVLYAGEVSSAAVDPASGTMAFVPYDPSFFPLQADPSLGGPIAAQWTDAAGTLTEGGIYLLRRGSVTPERLAYEEWFTAYEDLTWIPEVERFFGAWSLTVSFTAEGELDRVFPERDVPIASPDGKWLVFRRPPHVPGIAVYTPDGDLAYEFEGMTVSDIVWKRDSTGVYLYSPEAGLRFFSPSQLSYETLVAAPAIIGGSLRLIHPDAGGFSN